MFDKIKNSTKYVIENSKYVSINYSKLDKFIKNIDCTNLKNWLLYNPYNLLELNVEKIINFLLFFEAIDYSFWGEPKWQVETKEGLKGCADYKIPQTLRALEIIRYNDELSKIIDSKKEIEVNSLYEIEIRASQIVVLEYIKNKLKNIDSIDINDFLFLYSKQIKAKAKPYHLCRNTNY